MTVTRDARFYPPLAVAEAEGKLLAATARLEQKIVVIDELKKSQEALKKSVDDLTHAQATRDGSATTWRRVGSIAVAITVALASGALTLAFNATADHQRVETLEAEVDELHTQRETARAAEASRWQETQEAIHRADVAISTTAAVLARVEARLNELDQRTARRTH